MREILFRGKRIDTGEWIVGQLIRYNDGRARIVETGENIFCYEMDISIIQTVAHHVAPESVGQYTGLCDKNGKKIFEGDIIQHGKRKGTIFYYGNFGMFMISWIPNGGANNFMNVHHAEVEVIGNIHDNPELLEVSHE